MQPATNRPAGLATARRIGWWFSIAVAFTCIVGWSVSYPGTPPCMIPGTDWQVKLQQGGLVIQTGLPSARILVAPSTVLQTFFWSGWDGRVATVTVGARTISLFLLPLWMPLALSALAAALTRRPPRLPGHCPACQYDLRSTPGACPECGHRP